MELAGIADMIRLMMIGSATVRIVMILWSLCHMDTVVMIGSRNEDIALDNLNPVSLLCLWNDFLFVLYGNGGDQG